MKRRTYSIVKLGSICTYIGIIVLLSACAKQEQRSVLKEFKLYETKVDLGKPSWLAAFAATEISGSLDPSGKKLLYASDENESLDIWLKDLTTGGAERLTTHAAIDTHPVFMPDGKTILFVSMRRDAKGDLYLLKDKKLERLTDQKLAENYPTVAKDGTIYFSAGSVSRTRIHRMTLKDRKSIAVSRWGATHPAVNPDHSLLAFMWRDARGRNRIVVKRLADQKTFIISDPDYHAGFPTFSPDGKSLAFVRMYRGAPFESRKTSDYGTLFRVEIKDILAFDDPKILMKKAKQLTSLKDDVLLPHWHQKGIVFTGRHADSVDVGLLSAKGILPALNDTNALISLAEKELNPWDKLFVYRSLFESTDSKTVADAKLKTAYLYLAQSQFKKAEELFNDLLESGVLSYPQIAKLELITLPVAVERWKFKRGQNSEWRQSARSAIAQLKALSFKDRDSRFRDNDGVGKGNNSRARIESKRLFKLGETYHLLGEKVAAIQSYQELLRAKHLSEKDELAARFALGKVYRLAKTPRRLAEYYLALFKRYEKHQNTLKEIASEIVDLFKDRPSDEEIAILRDLSDKHADYAIFISEAFKRIAKLYLDQRQYELAIDALSKTLITEKEAQLNSDTPFIFSKVLLLYSDYLKRQKRASEALGYYERALDAYEDLMKRTEKESADYERARKEYLKLSLMRAASMSLDGDGGPAEKAYMRLVKFDREIVSAHRELARLKIKRGQKANEILQKYEDGKDDDYVNLYMRAFLATYLHKKPTKRDFSRAEDLAKRASALRPSDPFAHMLLGWIYEMRERYHGVVGRGWLEESLLRYQRAKTYNDERIDSMTESDLVGNITSVLMAIGGDWEQIRYNCNLLVKHNYRFRSKSQEAFHFLSCARADTSLKYYQEAKQKLERLLDLADQLKFKRLDLETGLRLALVEHQRGDYKKSTELFVEAQKKLIAIGDKKPLAGLERTTAYNALLENDRKETLKKLVKAETFLKKNGATTVPDIIPIVPPGVQPSLAPMGFDRSAEKNTQLALKEIVYESADDLKQAVVLAEKRLKRLTKIKLEDAKPGHLFEISLLRYRIAINQRSLGNRARFIILMDQALKDLASVIEIEQPPEHQALNASIAINYAFADMRDAVKREQLVTHFKRLAHIQAFWKENEKEVGAVQYSARLRLSLAAAIAQLAAQMERLPTRKNQIASNTKSDSRFRGNDEGEGKDSRFRGSDEKNRSDSRFRDNDVISRVSALDVKSQLKESGKTFNGSLYAAAHYHELLAQTASDQFLVEPSGVESITKGVFKSLWSPMSKLEQLKFHIYVSLNFVNLATRYLKAEQLASHSSLTILEDLAAHTLKKEVGALRFLILAELNYRRRDLDAMRSAVDSFLKRNTLLLGPDYLTQGPQIRKRIFSLAINLAFELNQPAEALRFSELADQRMVADELMSTPLEGRQGAKKKITALVHAAKAYREIYVRQNLDDNEKAYEAWYNSHINAQRKVIDALDVLKSSEPELGRLLKVENFSLSAFRKLMHKDERILGFIRAADKQWIYAFSAQGKIEFKKVRKITPQIFSKEFIQDAKVMRFANLSRKMLSEELLKKEHSHLINLSELMDAYRMRLPLLKGVVWAKGNRENERDRQTLENLADDKGTLVLDAKHQRGGRSKASHSFMIKPHKGAQAPYQNWSLLRSVAKPMRYGLALITKPSPSMSRDEKLTLLRLMHAMGISRIGLKEKDGALDDDRVKELISTLATNQYHQMARKMGYRFYGDFSHLLNDTPAELKKELGFSIKTGAGSQKRKAYRKSERFLERAIRLMKTTGSEKYLDGATQFLANAITLAGDVHRGLRPMMHLIELRKAKVKDAKAPKAKLMAQAKLVQGLVARAWIELRGGKLEDSLKTNQDALNIFIKLKRKSSAPHVYEQRSIIAEKYGDYRQAYDAATNRLNILSAKAKKSTRAKDLLNALDAQNRVIKILRMRLSRLDLAQAHVERAEHTLADYRARLGKIKHKEKNEITKKIEVNFAERAIRLALENARIASAKGDYRQAIHHGESGLKIAQNVNLSTDEIDLEIVNNKYYLGEYSNAVQLADKKLSQKTIKAKRRIQFLNVKGTSLSALGKGTLAKRALKEAYALATKHKTEEAQTLTNIGDADKRIGSFRKAEESFELALALDQKVKDQFGIANDLANLGLNSALLGLNIKAEKEFNRSVVLSKKIKATRSLLKASAGLCRLYLSSDRFDEALNLANHSIVLTRKLGLRKWRWRFHLFKGLSYRAQKKQKAAKKELLKAISIIEAQPPYVLRAVNQPKIEAEFQDVYDQLIEITANENDVEESLFWIERFRARQLLDRLSSNLRGLKLKEKRSFAAWIETKEKLEVLRSTEERLAAKKQNLTDIQAKINELKTIQDEELKKLKENARAFDLIDSEKIDRETLKKNVFKNESILSFYPSLNEIIIHQLDEDRLLLKRVPLKRMDLEKLVKRFRRKLVSFAELKSISRQLYTLLLGKTDLKDTKRLLIITNGALAFLPFKALHNGKRYLIDDYRLSYRYALKDVEKDIIKKEFKPKTWAAFSVGSKANPPLPYAEREVKIVKEVFDKTKLYTGLSSSFDAFKENVEKDALHLALHMQINADQPLKSMVDFSDRPITIFELNTLFSKKKDMPKLWVLSGCSAGLGSIKSAESVKILPRTLKLLGADYIVSSYWRVNDLGAALLMKAFIRELGISKSVDEALHQAQLKIKSRHEHPGFWASFKVDR